MAAHRYWRVYIYDTTFAFVEAAEVEFRETIGVAQAPSGGTPITSGTWTDSNTYRALNAFDSNVNTRWRSQNGAGIHHYIGYDYGAGNEKDIVEFAYTSYINNDTPRGFSLQYSDDGITWASDWEAFDGQVSWGSRGQRVFTLVPAASVSIRTTQMPVMAIDLTNQPARITQIPALVISLPVQPGRITQIPAMVPTHYRPIPLPVPVVPEIPMTEVWDYLTVVTSSINNKEQRSRLRENPRIGMSFPVATLNDAHRREVYALQYRMLDREFTYPLYQYSARVTHAQDMGDVVIMFDNTITDIQSGEILALFDPLLEKTHYLNVDVASSIGVTLAEPLPVSVGNTWLVCATRQFRYGRNSGLTMSSVSGTTTFQMETTQDRALHVADVSGLLTTLNGSPLLPDPALIEADEVFTRNVDWLDNQSGVPVPRSRWRQTVISGNRAYTYDRRVSTPYWRAFAQAVKGRQKPFYIPTFFDDLPLHAAPALDATELHTSNLDANFYFTDGNNETFRWLRIITAAGVIYRRVNEVKIAYDANGDPEYLRLLLNQSIGTVPGRNNISRISYVYRARLGSDTFTIEHSMFASTISFDIQTVNQ